MTAPVSKTGLSSRPGHVHPVLWEQPGVADAVRAVEHAKAAHGLLREERAAEHRAWQKAIGASIGKPASERPVEPLRSVTPDEVKELRSRQNVVEAELDAVLVSVANAVLADASERELEILAEVREHVDALGRLRDEVICLGRALGFALVASGRGSRRQPHPDVDDLMYLVGKGEDAALFNFADPSDGRTRWLEETGRARG